MPTAAAATGRWRSAGRSAGGPVVALAAAGGPSRGQHDVNVLPTPRVEVDLDAAAVGLGQAASQREAQARARLPLARIADLLELVEHGGQILGCDPDPGVGHRDADVVAQRPPPRPGREPPSGVYLIAFDRRL